MARSRTQRRGTRVEELEPRCLLAGGVDRLVNDNAGAAPTGTAGFTQSGAVLAAFGNSVVTAFNDSGSIAGSLNSKFTGFAHSTNGGAHFTDGGTLPTNSAGDAGYPAMARDEATGRIYLLTIGLNDANSLRVFRSDTGGASWLAPANGTPGGSTEDKPWLTVDNFAGPGRGNVYVVSRRFGGTQGIYLFRSTDAGDTFNPSGGTFIAGAATVQGAFVTVGPDHAVYVFWYAGTTIQMSKSTDLGLSFAPAVTVASALAGGVNGDLGLTGVRNGTTTPAPFRTNEFPHAVVNPTNGNLYVTFANDGDGAGPDKADIFITQSSTAGTSWSTPVRVNDDATTTDQWFPTLAVSPDGTKLGVFYYSRQEDPTGNNLFRYYGRVATLSGATTTFAPSSAISDVASLPEFGRDNALGSTNVGDYNNAVATSDAFHVVWSDNRSAHPLPAGAPRKDPNVYYDRIPIGPPPAVTASAFNFATLPQRLSFTFSQNVGASLGLNDLIVTRTDGSMVVPSGLTYDPDLNTATFSFNAPLPDDRYGARLLASGIIGPGGNLPADHTFIFAFLRGDANGDGAVNLADFNVLAANFGQSPRDFTQGDFDYSGTVNLNDFNLLASRFGQSVASGLSNRSSDKDTTDANDLRKLLDASI